MTFRLIMSILTGSLAIACSVIFIINMCNHEYDMILINIVAVACNSWSCIDHLTRFIKLYKDKHSTS